MSKWHSFLEYIQFPLKVLFFAVLILGIGSLMINPNLGLIEIFDSIIILKISEVLRFFGAFLIKLFPMLVFLKLLTRKHEDSAPVFIGFLSLIIITIILMLFSSGEYASYYYTNILGIQIEMSKVGENIVRLHTPYNTGIISLVIAYFITTYAYRRSRHHIRHGLFYFIDHDTKAFLIASLWSVIAGLVLSLLWPYVIEVTQLFMNFIADDIYDVGHMFFYGIYERITVLLNLDAIPKSIFWLSEAGGSVVGTNGTAYLGDFGLWNAFMSDSSLVLKTGNFVGAYYIINIALIPAFILAYYRLMGKKKNKQKYLMFIVIALILSMLCGNALPMELLMVILSPLLYVFYLILVGFAYVVVSVLGCLPGYSVEGPLMCATPGSIIDLLWNMPNAVLKESVIILLIACIIFFVIFYFATIIYFKKAAVGLLSIRNINEITNETIEAMGGLENIQYVDTTPDKMSVAFKSRDLVKLRKLYELGAYLILESKEGYTIRMGNMNIMIGDKINIKLKEREI